MSGIERAEAIAELIREELAATDEGHCARVDYLERAEALAVCGVLRRSAEGRADDLAAFVLRGAQDGPVDGGGAGNLLIAADQAIERRNRKEERLCLFVPADIVDAAASSLGNSFAPIDGRELHAAALDRLLARAPSTVVEVARRCFGRLRGRLAIGVSATEKLDFLEAAIARDEAGQAERIGLELWRLGLLPDAGPDFLDRLEANGRHVLELSRPARLQAPLRERIQKLAVDGATANAQLAFLEGRPLHDARSWARDLSATAWTLDRWVFPELDRSDLRLVTVKSFLDANGLVRRASKLQQLWGPTGALVAKVGSKQKLSVGWTSDPQRPSNLARWRVEIVPVSGELDDFTASLPSREVPGQRDSATLSLDLDLSIEEIPNAPMWVRVVPLDAAGNEIQDGQGEPIAGTSEEFYLVEGGEGPEQPSGRLATVPTLAFGRLQASMAGGRSLVEEQAQWITRDLDYFTLRLNEKTIARVGLASPLHALEEQVLAFPRRGGRYLLECNDASVVGPEAFVAVAPPPERERWQPFLRARETFFQRVRRADARNLIEVAEWTPELASTAVRYAQTYRELVEGLTAECADPNRRAELMDALSLDTLRVRTDGPSGDDEVALVVLPTHPLRAAWYGGYAQLLARWESQICELEGAARRRAVDLELLLELAPSNTPPFAYWPGEAGAFVFFQNLRFFYGVALPPNAPDPHRRFADVAHVLGAGDDSSAGDLRPERLADHLREYRALHPYARRLELTLVNPDRGDLVSETLEAFPRSDASARLEEDGDATAVGTTFAVHAYVGSGRETPLRGLERVRRLQAEEYRLGEADFFAPMLESSVKTISDLDDAAPVEAHVAIASDLAQPRLAAARVDGQAARRSSFSLHGLIARFVSDFSAEGDSLRWLHRLAVDPAARPEPHPAGARFGDAVMDLQAALLGAGARLLGGGDGTTPALQVRVTPERRRLLEALHQQSDWVITVDRFFGPDYYDSPADPHLAEAARKYVLDYAPDFTEGLGHHVIVTTAWQDEVVRRLQRTMGEIGLAGDRDGALELLEHLKMVSGRLALRALVAEPGNADTTSLGAVIAWLRAGSRLAQAIAVPINLHGHLLGDRRVPLQQAADQAADEDCDCMLVSLRRNIVEATFVGVRWMRGDADPEDLAYDMLLPLERAQRLVASRFFDDTRVDGTLQRARLASVLRFYFERACRYGLFDPAHRAAFIDHLARLEKTGLDFRSVYEGYIVTPSSRQIQPFSIGDGRFTVLRPGELTQSTTLQPIVGSPVPRQAPLQLASEAIAEPERGTSPAVPTDLASAVAEDEDSAAAPAESDDATRAWPLPVHPVSTDTDRMLAAESRSEWAEAASVEPVRSVKPRQAGPEVEILLGRTVPAETEVFWRPSVRGSPHMFVLGIPGQGKSWAVARAVRELARQGVPALILDFHGQFTAVEGQLAGARQAMVLDAREGLPFSPFEVAEASGDTVDWQSNAFAVAEIFGYVCKLGDMQRDVVFTAVRDAYRAHGFGRDSEDGPEDSSYPSLREILTRIERQERAGRATNVAARCRPLLEMDLFKPPPGGDGTDLLTLVRGGLVIDLHRLADLEVLQLAVGAFVLRKVYKDMFSWGEADNLRLAIVLDEAHRLARDVTLPKLMKEGRKFGISVIVASQGMSDFHADVLGNAGTKVIFRMNHPDSRRVAGFIRVPAGVNLADRIEQLSVGHAYIQTPEMRLGSVVKIQPPDTR